MTYVRTKAGFVAIRGTANGFGDEPKAGLDEGGFNAVFNTDETETAKKRVDA